MNVLKPDKKSTIITLLTNGINQREISRKTKISRKTVRRYANESGLFPANPDLDSKSPREGEVATGPDCIIGQNAPPRPPGNSVYKEEKRAIPLHARSACDPHREWIEDQVRLERNAVSIYQDMVERFAFTNKYNSVKRFVRGLKKKWGTCGTSIGLLVSLVWSCGEMAEDLFDRGLYAYRRGLP